MANRDRTVRVGSTGSVGGVYLLTIIGAAVYFIQNADGFWSGVLGLLQAIVWPAFVMYHVLELLGA